MVLVVAVVLGSVLLPPAEPAQALTLTVTRFDDVSRGACIPGDCSLREAILAANARPILAPGHHITLPAGTYTLTIAGRNDDTGAVGDLDIRWPTMIEGDPVAYINGNDIDGVFHILPGAGEVTLRNLRIGHGNRTPTESVAVSGTRPT
jgi:CSLREA domain-containing protein